MFKYLKKIKMEYGKNEKGIGNYRFVYELKDKDVASLAQKRDQYLRKTPKESCIEGVRSK